MDSPPVTRFRSRLRKKIRQDYIRFGEVRYGWIGVGSVEDDAKEVDGSRASVTDIVSDTPAAKSGIQKGDVLLQVGNVHITSKEDILDASFFLTAGDETAVTVVRDGKKMTFNVRSVRNPSSTVADDTASPDATPSVNALAPDSQSVTNLYLGIPGK